VAPATAEHGGTDQAPHGSARAFASGHNPLLGTPSRVSEVLRGKEELSMARVAAVAYALPCTSRPADSAAQASAARNEGGRDLMELQ
jgi:hypothetical protein